jgi:hypothetical protein
MTVLEFAYSFSNATTAPPTSNQVRIDAVAPYTAASKVWATALTTDGHDVVIALLHIPIGATLYIQDKNDHTVYVSFTTTAAPVDQTTYVEFAVTWQANGTALNNNQAIDVYAFDRPLPGGGPGPPAAQLVTLQQAKDHLNITTPAGDPDDADLTLKLAAAEALVLDYCGSTAYWRDITATWTSATVPMQVQAAILFQCADLFRFRGDDTRTDQPDRTDGYDLSQAVRDLLRRLRDPVVA